MPDFKAKMHQIRFRLGLCPRPRWGAYNAPHTPSWIKGEVRGRGGAALGKREEREGKGREGKVEGGKGRAPKLLLNQYQGPSEPCYATARTGPTLALSTAATARG